MSALQWCFTQNNIQEYFTNLDSIEFCQYQVESVTRVHIQGIVRLTKRCRLTFMKKLLPSAHWEVCKNWSRSLQYTSKIESRIFGPYQIGALTDQIQKNPKQNPSEVVDAIKKRRTEEVVGMYPNLWRSVRSIECCRQVFSSPRKHATKGIVFSGKSGTGKSKIAGLISAFVGDTAWLSTNLKWFDGYSGEDLVVFDEFRVINDVSLLLRILDRYPLRVEVKGGFVQWKPHMCIFTTNLNRVQLYGMLDELTVAALDRRLTWYTVY